MKRSTQLLTSALIIIVVLTSMGAVSLTQAGVVGTYVPYLPGFEGSSDKGLELPGGGIYQSSTTLADLNHDGRLEILAGSGRDYDGQYRGNGYIHAIRWDGTILWSSQGRNAGEIGADEIQPPINSSPSTIPDINGDGWDDVVVSLGGEASASNWDGGVAAFSGQTGQRLWIYNADDWLNQKPDEHLDGVFSTPAVSDVDGDGDDEIAFGGWDQCIYLLDHQGNPLWTNPIRPGHGYCNDDHGYYNEDTTWSSPAIADLDGDGQQEIIIGADISEGNINDDPNGGYLYVFGNTGVVRSRVWVDDVVFSSPAVADLDNDGQMDIVVGTGHHPPIWPAGIGHYVKAWTYSPTDGLVAKWTGNTSGEVFSSPALADLNGDGILDVIAISYVGDWNACSGSQVYAWRGDNGALLAGFPATPRTASGSSTNCIMASPTVADVDNDDHLEILFSQGWEVTVLNHDGSPYTDDGSGGKPTLGAYCSLSNSPAVGDIDNDGDLEIAAGGNVTCDASRQGGMHVWQTSSAANKARPWPMFHKNAQHTGGVDQAPKLRVSPARLSFLLEPTDEPNHTAIVYLSNQGGGGPIAWEATSNRTWLTVAPASGETDGTLTLNIQVPQTVTGTLRLGTNTAQVSIHATTAGVENPDQVVDVFLCVGDVQRVFLPTVLKNR